MPGLLGAVAIVLVFLLSGLKVLREYERAVVFRLGRLVGARGPGLVYVIPGIEKALRIDLRTITMDIPSQDVITKDNVSLKVNAVLYFRVMDPNHAVVEVENYLFATSQLAQTTLRSVCGEAQLDELLAEREKINAHLQSIIDQHTEPWGIKVVQVAVKHIDLPEEMRRAMAKQAEAERERRAGGVLVVNDTRVIPARVSGRRPSGGRLELLFVAPLGEEGEWEVLVRGTARPGERVHLAGGRGEWVAPLGDGRWRLRLALDEPVLAWLERVGEVPLPPYVRRAPTPADRERYQTVYARVPGAVAAPTAGLHLSAELPAAIAAAGVRVATLTLHVGPGTFLPIRTDDLDQHVMAPEPSDIPPATVEAIGAARARGGRVVAVGTTTVRALE